MILNSLVLNLLGFVPKTYSILFIQHLFCVWATKLVWVFLAYSFFFIEIDSKLLLHSYMSTFKARVKGSLESCNKTRGGGPTDTNGWRAPLFHLCLKIKEFNLIGEKVLSPKTLVSIKQIMQLDHWMLSSGEGQLSQGKSHQILPQCIHFKEHAN